MDAVEENLNNREYMTDYINILPAELLRKIARRLDLVTLLFVCPSVCRRWNSIFMGDPDNMLYRDICSFNRDPSVQLDRPRHFYQSYILFHRSTLFLPFAASLADSVSHTTWRDCCKLLCSQLEWRSFYLQHFHAATPTGPSLFTPLCPFWGTLVRPYSMTSRLDKLGRKKLYGATLVTHPSTARFFSATLRGYLHTLGHASGADQHVCKKTVSVVGELCQLYLWDGTTGADAAAERTLAEPQRMQLERCRAVMGDAYVFVAEVAEDDATVHQLREQLDYLRSHHAELEDYVASLRGGGRVPVVLVCNVVSNTNRMRLLLQISEVLQLAAEWRAPLLLCNVPPPAPSASAIVSTAATAAVQQQLHTLVEVAVCEIARIRDVRVGRARAQWLADYGFDGPAMGMVQRSVEGVEWLARNVFSLFGLLSFGAAVAAVDTSADAADGVTEQFTVVWENWYGRKQNRILRLQSDGFQRVHPMNGSIRALHRYDEVIKVVVEMDPRFQIHIRDAATGKWRIHYYTATYVTRERILYKLRLHNPTIQLEHCMCRRCLVKRQTTQTV